MSTRWSTIFLGGVIAVSLTILLLFLGTGVGLSFLPVPDADSKAWLGIGIVAALSLFGVFAISGFVGSYLATSLFFPASKREAIVHGLGVWGVLTLMQTVLAGMFLVPAISNASAGGAAGLAAASFWEEFRRANPRIVSDLKILDGKVVTTLDLNKGVTLPRLVKSAEKSAVQLAEAADADKGKQATGALALVGCLSLLTSGLLSVAGSLVGYRKPPFAGAAAQPDAWRKGASAA